MTSTKIYQQAYIQRIHFNFDPNSYEQGLLRIFVPSLFLKFKKLLNALEIFPKGCKKDICLVFARERHILLAIY